MKPLVQTPPTNPCRDTLRDKMSHSKQCSPHNQNAAFYLCTQSEANGCPPLSSMYL